MNMYNIFIHFDKKIGIVLSDIPDPDIIEGVDLFSILRVKLLRGIENQIALSIWNEYNNYPTLISFRSEKT